MAEAEAPLEVTPGLAGELFSRETTENTDVPRPLEANTEAKVS